MTDDQTVADLRGDGPHPLADRAPRGAVQEVVRLVSALLPVASHVLDAASTPTTTGSSDSTRRPAGTGGSTRQLAPGLAEQGRLLLGPHRQVPQRLRERHPRRCPPGWNEWYGAVDPTTYRMWGYTLNENGGPTTYGKPVRRGPGALPDRRLQPQGDRLHRAAPTSEPVLPLGRLPRPPPRGVADPAGTGQTVRPAPRHGDAGRRARSPPALLRRARPVRQAGATAAPLAAAQPGGVDQITANYRTGRSRCWRWTRRWRHRGPARGRTGCYENTYIVFTSDNGFLQGEHRVAAGKMLVYDPSAGVPLLIRGPGHPARPTFRASW